MLYKLSWRNAKRSMKDYLIYIITMTGIAAFMYAFNSLIFSDIVQQMWEAVTIMSIMIGLVTFFIVLIVAWLINYMVHFMLEKRSQEFGTYLLLGMNKKQVSKLYMRENMLLGAVAFLAGIVIGTLLQQIIMSVFYHLFSQDYKIQIGGSLWCLLLTIVCYMFCFFFALRKNRKLFKKMSIANFMDMEKTGEMVETGHEKLKQWLFFISVAYFIFFYIGLFRGNYTVLSVTISIVLFLVSIYLFYYGLSAYLVCYIRKGGKSVYHRDGLFLLRQLASKMRTMRFTMGTLTILFTGALLGGTVAMMFTSYQSEAIENALPFDITVYSENPQEDFAEELALLKAEQVQEKSRRIYRIYTDYNHEMNDYLLMNLSTFGGMFVNEDGTLDKEAVEEKNFAYHEYDTYMALSDYNYLREMLGYEPIEITEEQYVLHAKERIVKDIDEAFLRRTLLQQEESLQFAGTRTEGFGQNGINGADYIFVVPDKVCEKLKSYYSVMAIGIEGSPAKDLQEKLEQVYYHKRGMLTEEEVMKKETELERQGASEAEIAALEELNTNMVKISGSDQILTMGCSDVTVKAIEGELMLSIVSSVTFPLAYISLIFICVALTILSVQQLSDSERYRYRYDILRKMGVDEKSLGKIVGKQLAMYYLVPLAVSMALSSIIGIFAGERFIFYTGAKSNFLSYFAVSVVVFMGIYLLYVAATYLGFKKNVEQVFTRME